MLDRGSRYNGYMFDLRRGLLPPNEQLLPDKRTLQLIDIASVGSVLWGDQKALLQDPGESLRDLAKGFGLRTDVNQEFLANLLSAFEQVFRQVFTGEGWGAVFALPRELLGKEALRLEGDALIDDHADSRRVRLAKRRMVPGFSRLCQPPTKESLRMMLQTSNGADTHMVMISRERYAASSPDEECYTETTYACSNLEESIINNHTFPHVHHEGYDPVRGIIELPSLVLFSSHAGRSVGHLQKYCGLALSTALSLHEDTLGFPTNLSFHDGIPLSLFSRTDPGCRTLLRSVFIRLMNRGA